MSAGLGRFQAVRSAAITMTALEIAYLAPSHPAETPNIGVLFVVAGVLLVGVLVSRLTGLVRLVGWLFGAGVCAGMFAGFVLSRRAGLPGYRETWTSDHWLGVAYLPLGVVFVACPVYALRFRRAPGTASYPLYGICDAEAVETRRAAAAQAWRASTDIAGMR
jgi:hypothetical protein